MDPCKGRLNEDVQQIHGPNPVWTGAPPSLQVGNHLVVRPYMKESGCHEEQCLLLPPPPECFASPVCHSLCWTPCHAAAGLKFCTSLERSTQKVSDFLFTKKRKEGSYPSIGANRINPAGSIKRLRVGSPLATHVLSVLQVDADGPTAKP